MGAACCLGGRVPFTIRGGGSLTSYAVNGTRGDRSPLVNPRGPARKSVLRTALTSRVPDYGRLDSTSCLGSPLSAIHGVQTLSFPLRFADFSGDTTPSLSYCRLQIKTKSVSLKARFCRPDKAKPPSGNRCRGENAGWRVPLIRPTRCYRNNGQSGGRRHCNALGSTSMRKCSPRSGSPSRLKVISWGAVISNHAE